MAFAQTGRAAEAVKEFERMLEKKSDGEAYFNLALGYSLVGRRADAVASCQKAIALAREAGKTQLADGIEAWLRSYQQLVR